MSGTPDTTYVYDNTGKVSEVRTGTAFVTYTYDTAGRLSKKAFSNGVETSYSYNDRGKLSQVVTRREAAVVASHSYTYDANGNRTRVEDSGGESRYVYSTAGRLTSESVNSTLTGTFNKVYSYDLTGNRSDSGMRISAGDMLSSDSGGTYSYDARGNRTGYAGRTYQYDSASRLIRFSDGATVATYEYDHSGRRIAKTVGGIRREFVYDGDQLVGESMGEGGSVTARFTNGPGVDEVLFVVRDGKTLFYHADAMANIVAVTDETGSVIQRYGYDAWGNLRQNAGSLSFRGSSLLNVLTYGGREFDEESGLYHFRARAYDPATGRFLQRDPQLGHLSDPRTQHPYAYAHSNPVNLRDPSGTSVMFEYTMLISAPSPAEQSAALIGYMHGFGTSNLVFIGEYMGLLNAGYSMTDLWDEAVERTKNKVVAIGESLGLLGKFGECEVSLFNRPGLDQPRVEGLKEVLGIVGAYADGAEMPFKATTGSVLIGSISVMLGEPGTFEKAAECMAKGVDKALDKNEIVKYLELNAKFGGYATGAELAVARLRLMRPR